MPAFRESLTLYVKKLNDETARDLALAAHALEDRILREQRARLGIDPGVVTAVDGDRNKTFEQVRPDGLIWMGFDYRAEAVTFAFEELTIRSPHRSGEYARSHFCLLDGAALPPLVPPSPEMLDNVRTVTITNDVPYARRLEVGTDKSGQAFVKQVQPHIYEGAMAATRRRYSAIAKIGFGYVDLTNAYQLRGTRRRNASGAVRAPAIIIERK